MFLQFYELTFEMKYLAGVYKINGIELQYMLKYMLNYIVRADDCDICWIVGFNLTFDVHKKPDTFTLLHHTVIMALAFWIIVNKKKAVTYCASKPCL